MSSPPPGWCTWSVPPTPALRRNCAGTSASSARCVYFFMFIYDLYLFLVLFCLLLDVRCQYCFLLHPSPDVCIVDVFFNFFYLCFVFDILLLFDDRCQYYFLIIYFLCLFLMLFCLLFTDRCRYYFLFMFFYLALFLMFCCYLMPDVNTRYFCVIFL